jgi:acyl carrier protein
MRSETEIIDDLAAILRCFRGREYSEPIGPETLFFADLGFASIDAVVLGETLENHYGQSIPFGKFLAEVGKEGVRDIEVGRLARFLNQSLV